MADWIQFVSQYWQQLLAWLKGLGAQDPVALVVTVGIFAFTVIGAGLKWLVPLVLRFFRKSSATQPLNHLFPFEVIAPPNSVAEADEQTFLRQLMASQEPMDYPLADFNIPYQQRHLQENVRERIMECFRQKNWVLILGRSGLGKTREAAQLAFELHRQGWTILRLTINGKWLQAPMQFPSDKITS